MDGFLLMECGCEGGAYRLVAEITAAGFLSFRVRGGWSLGDLDDDQPSKGAAPLEEPVVIDWAGAMRLLDRCHWIDLYPLFIHPMIADRLLDELSRRSGKDGYDTLTQWQICAKDSYRRLID